MNQTFLELSGFRVHDWIHHVIVVIYSNGAMAPCYNLCESFSHIFYRFRPVYRWQRCTRYLLCGFHLFRHPAKSLSLIHFRFHLYWLHSVIINRLLSARSCFAHVKSVIHQFIRISAYLYTFVVFFFLLKILGMCNDNNRCKCLVFTLGSTKPNQTKKIK